MLPAVGAALGSGFLIVRRTTPPMRTAIETKMANSVCYTQDMSDTRLFDANGNDVPMSCMHRLRP